MSNKSRGQRAETALRAILQERGYLVIRSAASKVYDLVCVDEGGFVIFLEVKSVKDGHCFRVSRTAMTKEQHEQMQRDENRYGGPNVIFAYAVRFPDGEYRIYGGRVIMPQHEGLSLDEAFPVRDPPAVASVVVSGYINGAKQEPVRITPNNPPIVPHGSDARVVLDEGDKDTRGSWYIAPDGDTRDAQC